MNNDAVLNIRPLSDDDRRYIAANRRAKPDAAPITDGDIAVDRRIVRLPVPLHPTHAINSRIIHHPAVIVLEGSAVKHGAGVYSTPASFPVKPKACRPDFCPQPIYSRGSIPFMRFWHGMGMSHCYDRPVLDGEKGAAMDASA